MGIKFELINEFSNKKYYITVMKVQEDYVFNFIDSVQIKHKKIGDYGIYKKYIMK